MKNAERIEKIEELKKRAEEIEAKLETADSSQFDSLLRELRNTENLIYKLENPVDYSTSAPPPYRTATMHNTTFESRHN